MSFKRWQELAWRGWRISSVPSLLACLIIYLAVRPVRPFALPSPVASRPVIYRLAIGWLLAWLDGRVWPCTS